MLAKGFDKSLSLLSLSVDDYTRLMLAYGRLRQCPQSLANAMATEAERHLGNGIPSKNLTQLMWACEAMHPAMLRLQRRLEVEV